MDDRIIVVDVGYEQTHEHRYTFVWHADYKHVILHSRGLEVLPDEENQLRKRQTIAREH